MYRMPFATPELLLMELLADGGAASEAQRTECLRLLGPIFGQEAPPAPCLAYAVMLLRRWFGSR